MSGVRRNVESVRGRRMAERCGAGRGESAERWSVSGSGERIPGMAAEQNTAERCGRGPVVRAALRGGRLGAAARSGRGILY